MNANNKRITHIQLAVLAILLQGSTVVMAQAVDPHAGHTAVPAPADQPEVIPAEASHVHSANPEPTVQPETVSAEASHDHSGDQPVGQPAESATMSSMEQNNSANASMDTTNVQTQGGKAPAGARDPHAYSGGYTLSSGPYALPGPRQLHMADEHNFRNLRMNRFEKISADEDFSTYDAQAWFGSTYQKLVVKAEGDFADGRLEESNTDFLYSRALTSYWDAQLGLRADFGTAPDKQWLAVGLQGLARYWFELDVTAYLGESGSTALAFEAEYDFLLTQRLILQPRAELNFYGKRDAAAGVGSGLSDAAFGLRLRYEFSRQFAPYIGIERGGKYGETAEFIQGSGTSPRETRLLAGLRVWF